MFVRLIEMKEGKRNVEEVEENVTDEPPPKKKTKRVNKKRPLVLCSRGMNFRYKRLMQDLKKLMPHHRPELNMGRSKTLSGINDMCVSKNCNKALLFEGRRKQDLYIWMSNVPNGPSARFIVDNVDTTVDTTLTGNCLCGSTPLLRFDPGFSDSAHYLVLRELLLQMFGVPNKHPNRPQNHIYTFTIVDDKICFRNYRKLSEKGALVEIGPRFMLNPIKIFAGSFGGQILWEDPKYISLKKYRRHIHLAAKKKKYVEMKTQKPKTKTSKQEVTYLNPLDDIFSDSSDTQPVPEMKK
ncbi:hypothetical protein FQR65_LT10705 [Abscondita terminalis]|nr:hypothetical protein FQR65_LT10705 [Abscondita terminalis]